MNHLHGYTSFTDPTILSANLLGTLGEKTVLRDFRRNGILAQKPTAQKAGDVWVTDPVTGVRLHIEVKTSFRGKDGKFQFCLYRKIKNGRVCTDHGYAQLVVLLAVEDDMSYTTLVIPAQVLTTKKIGWGSLSKSKYAAFVRSTLVI